MMTLGKLRDHAIRTWVSVIVMDKRGQDLIEYALLGGFISVAVGAVFPTTIVPSISTILSKVQSVLDRTVTRMT